MKTSRTAAIFEHEQPDEAAWSAADRYIRNWEASRKPQLLRFPGMWMLTFEWPQRADYDEFVAGLERLRESDGVVYKVSLRTHLEDIDFQVADYVQFLGAEIESDEAPFLLNESEAVGPPLPCAVCGAAGVFRQPKLAPYAIDEARLDEDTESEQLEWEGGWDIANMPNGHLLVSDHVVEVLEECAATGYRLETVMDRLGRPSERVFQLVAERKILVPCLEHSRFNGDTPCPECGAGRGTLTTYFWVTLAQTGGVDVLSRHAEGMAMLYVSRRIRDALSDAQLNGLYWVDVMRVCDHPA